MHYAIASKQQQIEALCREYGVRRLEIFGSAARGTDFDPTCSDADFLVAFKPGGRKAALDEFFGLKAALSDLIGRPVDLVEAGAIRNPYILEAIDQDRELLYAA